MPTETQLYDEAIELKEAGKLDEAVGKLEALVAAHPDFALAHAALGVFYEKLGRHEEAVVQARKVCDLEPADPFSFMAMSLICQRGPDGRGRAGDGAGDGTAMVRRRRQLALDLAALCKETGWPLAERADTLSPSGYFYL